MAERTVGNPDNEHALSPSTNRVRQEVRHWPHDPFDRALAAEPQLRAIDELVRLLIALAPKAESGESLCAGCIWERIVKPLVTPWIGWERPHHPHDAPDNPAFEFKELSAELLAEEPPPPTSAIERWLRSSDAYDIVTDQWLEILDRADPGNGHGFRPHEWAAAKPTPTVGGDQ